MRASVPPLSQGRLGLGAAAPAGPSSSSSSPAAAATAALDGPVQAGKEAGAPQDGRRGWPGAGSGRRKPGVARSALPSGGNTPWRGLSGRGGVARPLGPPGERPGAGPPGAQTRLRSAPPRPPRHPEPSPPEEPGSGRQGTRKHAAPERSAWLQILPHADSVHTADGGAARETTSPVFFFLKLAKSSESAAFGTRRSVPGEALLGFERLRWRT